MAYQLYAVDSSGTRVFLPKVYYLELENITAGQGNNDYKQAVKATEKAVAKIFKEQTTLGDITVTP